MLQYLPVLTTVSLLRRHKPDLAVLMLVVVPVYKPFNPLPGRCQILEPV